MIVKKSLSVGYFNKEQINKINNIINQDPSKITANNNNSIELSDLVYASVEDKRKQLNTSNTFIVLKEDIIPISQIPLLEIQSSKTALNRKNSYFYIYYQTTKPCSKETGDSKIVERAIKKYFDDIVETEIKKTNKRTAGTWN